MTLAIPLAGALLMTLQNPPDAVFPRPQQMIEHGGARFDFTSETVLYDASAGNGGEPLEEMLGRAAGIKLKRTDDRSKVGQKGVVAFLPAFPNDGLKAEGYSLKVTSESITIKFADEAGAFYAAQTLRQLLPKDIESQTHVRGVKWTVPQVEIVDWPRFSWRGMLLDVSRHFYSPDTIKRLLDFLAMHKMNRFHWHLTDDGGWRVEIPKHPKLTEVGAWRVDTGGQWPGGEWNYSSIRFPGPGTDKKLYGGFYSRDQIKDIVSYAARRHITIVPEIEMPGHALAAIVSYPELACENIEPFPEPGFIRSNNYCPGKDETLRFLKDVLDDTMALFPSPWIHIGADEVYKGYWQKCPKCQERIAKEGLTQKNGHSAEENLQSWFVKQMEDYLWRKGRRLIGWDEILEGGLTPGATVMSWRGIEGGIAAAKSGHEAIMCPTTHCYFDYDYQTTSTQHVYGWEPIPEQLNATEAKFILGGQANVWTEWIPTQERVEYMIFPRILAMSEVLWLEKGQKNWDDFGGRLAHYYGRLDEMKANYNMPQPEVNFGAVLFQDFAEVSAKHVGGMQFALRYTTDGSAPTGASPEYKHPIRVDKDTTVTFAYVNGQGNAGDPARVECRKVAPLKDLGTLISGLNVDYYEGRWMALPDFAKMPPLRTALAKTVGLEHSTKEMDFGLRFSGFVEIPKEGVYTFSLISDDGSALWIAGAKVVDNDGPHPPQERSASVRLRPGVYPLEIGFFQIGGARALEAYVSGPDMPRQPLSQIALTKP